MIGKIQLWDRKSLDLELTSLPDIVGPQVYFLEALPLPTIKIGFVHEANALQWRIKDLQTGCPYKLEVILAVPGTLSLERDTHNYFAIERLQGEWFQRSKRLNELIKQLRDGTDLRDALDRMQSRG